MESLKNLYYVIFPIVYTVKKLDKMRYNGSIKFMLDMKLNKIEIYEFLEYMAKLDDLAIKGMECATESDGLYKCAVKYGSVGQKQMKKLGTTLRNSIFSHKQSEIIQQ
jgi:hypothetical protein